jgi:Kef-type K+ transport system membrane component KefB
MFIFGLVLLLGLSYLANHIGIAAIIGAFMAGLLLADYSHESEMHTHMHAIGELLMPFFFVDIGMRVTAGSFTEGSTVLFVVLLTVIAALTKLVGCGLGAARLGWRDATAIGVGMIPRGEVGIVVAQLGLAVNVLSGTLYSSLVVMAVVTTLIVPPILQRMLGVLRPQPIEAPM